MLMTFQHQTFIRVESNAKVPAAQLTLCIQDDLASVNFVSAPWFHADLKSIQRQGLHYLQPSEYKLL